MQSAESYLNDLHGRLSQLKLSLSREISSPTSSSGADAIRHAMQDVEQLLRERSKRSANSLDATLKLRLSEPVRSRFSLQGLDSSKPSASPAARRCCSAVAASWPSRWRWCSTTT